MKFIARGVATIAIVLGSVLGGGPAAQAASSGLNDWGCAPSAAHPEPVVMLHGLGASGSANWFYHAPKLQAAGYCVFTPTYGQTTFGDAAAGLASMRDSSKQVAAYVDKVLAATGADEVDLVGHSEGTTVAAYYLKYDGGAAKVKRFVGFGSNFRGTELYGLRGLIKALLPWLTDVEKFVTSFCPACLEYLPPNDFLDDLNAGGLTVPGVDYTSIISTTDTVVMPYTSGRIGEAGATDITLQNVCPLDLSGHLTMAVDPNVNRLIRRALDPEHGPAMWCNLTFPTPF